MPKNISKTSLLEIKQPCQVWDAYQLICNFPNLKTVLVGGRKYTHQEIRQMPFNAQMGGPETDRTVFNTLPIDIGAGQIARPPRAVFTATELTGPLGDVADLTNDGELVIQQPPF